MRAALMLGLCMLLATTLPAQKMPPVAPAADSDGDGLSDSLEDQLLLQFEPRFMISREDCSVKPAAFETLQRVPTVVADDGTIYGQASPRKGHTGEIELHYYHLW